MARAAIEALLRSSLREAAARHGWTLASEPSFVIEAPRDPALGDAASNLALGLAKGLGVAPMQVASAIAEALPADQAIAEVTVAPPGFLNFRLHAGFLRNYLKRQPNSEEKSLKLAILLAEYEDRLHKAGQLRVFDDGVAVPDWRTLPAQDRPALRFHMLLPTTVAGSRLDLTATRREVLDNPWFFVRQAGDRMDGILEAAEAEGLIPAEVLEEGALQLDEERRLMVLVALVEGERSLALELGQLSRLTRSAIELATGFHHFYTACRVFGEEPKTAEARLTLIAAARRALNELLTPFEPRSAAA